MPQSQFTHTFSGGKVHIIGNQPRLIDNPERSYLQALSFGAQSGLVAQLIVASDASQPGHKSVYPALFDDVTAWDGAVIKEPKSAIVFQTADCPAVILHDRETGKTAAFHAGRPALSPDEHCASCTVVGNGLHALIGNNRPTESIEAVIVGSICGQCFKHDRPEAQSLIAPFLNYPPEVFADRSSGALDLREVIRHLLVHAGMDKEQIMQHGPCTFETPSLASYRRDRTTLRNTIIVVQD